MHGECLQKRYDWDKLCFQARERGTAISMEGYKQTNKQMNKLQITKQKNKQTINQTNKQIHKLCFKARERGTAISMEGLGKELGTRDSQVKICHQITWKEYLTLIFYLIFGHMIN